MHDMPEGFPQGPEGLRAFVEAFRQAFPDLHWTIEDVIASGDKVVWRVNGTGTNEGPFMGMPATGRRISCGAIIISRFEDGRWAEDWVQWDRMTMLQQLGVIPEAAPA